jgi:hypothetical protein
MPPPYVAVVNRKPAETTPTLAPSQLNARLREVIAPQQAPDKPRQGDTPARAARMPMYAVLAMRQKRAVMNYAQSGVIPKSAFRIAVSSPQGKSLTWDERINIERREAEAYGSRFTVSPQHGTDEARIRLLLGV